MRRVNLFDFNQDDFFRNFLVHLARYKFVESFLKNGDKILEIGSGYGYGARFLADRKKVEVFALEPDENCILLLRETFPKDNITFYEGYFDTAFVSKWYEQNFDVVVSLEVIEHLDKSDQSRFLSNITALNAKLVIISTPRFYEGRSENRKIEHKHEFSPEEFYELLSKHFVDVQIFGQIDEHISKFNLQNAWNLIAVCH